MTKTAVKKHEPKKTTAAARGKHGGAKKVNFKIKARPESVVYLVGTFNQWDPAANPMEPDGDGWHLASLTLSPGRHEYKFLIDGAWRLDPECAECVPNAFGSQNHVLEIW